MIKKAVVLMVTAAMVAACGGGSKPESDQAAKKLNVLATTGYVADLARNVAGEYAQVEGLMASVVDPHIYKASAGDVEKLSSADLILYTGLHLEGKMGEIFEKVGRTKPVVAVAERLPREELLGDPDYPDQHDPHVWFDVRLWAQTVDVVVEALSQADPAHAAEFQARGAEYKAKVLEIDVWVTEQVSAIPESGRVLVTAHDAFSYFGRRYNMEVVGIQGISTVSEAGLADMKRVVDLLVDRKVKAIFVESSVPKNTVEAVQAACRERGHDLVIGGELFSDSMGAEGTEEGTYIGAVKHNVNTVVAALK